MACDPPVSVYRNWPLRLTAASIGVAPVVPVFPSAFRMWRLALRTSKPVTDALPVFATYANLPLFVTTTQQAAVSVVGTEALTTSSVPPPPNVYDDTALAFTAPPNASETIRTPCWLNAKPNGVSPADELTTGA